MTSPPDLSEPTAIKLPFAYGEVVPLSRTHRIRLAGDVVPPALAGANAVPVSFAELPRAGRDYPLVFVGAEDGKIPGLVALLGLRSGENLFVDAGGRWRAGVYVPAYVRRHPFCMATVTRDGVTQDERVVCVARTALDPQGGQALEDEAGEALPWWQERLHLINEYEVDLARTRQLCDTVARLGLLEPFGAQAVTHGGETLNLAGMFRVSERALERLKADELRMLIRKGIMGRLYAQMSSLDGFGRLLDLQAGGA